MSNQSEKILIRILIAVSLVGFLDTAYLTLDHYFGTGVQCLIVEGCDVVLKSEYAVILGIPLALVGLIFYMGMFVLVNLADIYRKEHFINLLAFGGVVGFFFSMVFLYIQAFVLEAYCMYCLMSICTSIFLAVFAIILKKQFKSSFFDKLSHLG